MAGDDMGDSNQHGDSGVSAALMQAQEIGKLTGMVIGVRDAITGLQNSQAQDRETFKQAITDIRAGQERSRDGVFTLLEKIHEEIKRMNDSAGEMDKRLVVLNEFKANTAQALRDQRGHITTLFKRIDVIEKSRERMTGWLLGASAVGGAAGSLIIFLITHFVHL